MKTKEIQQRLNIHGFAVTVDGEFGPKTKAAVKAFQGFMGLPADGEVGPVTAKWLKADPVKVERPSGDAPWMKWVEANIGQKEISGSKHNPFIVDLFKYTTYKTSTDETPWCAAFVCAALEKAGYKSTRSAAAASFDKYGTRSDLKYGAILTFHRSGGSGRHVTFFHSFDKNGDIIALGGNQSDQLKKSVYPKSRLVACRWPVKA